QVTKSLSSVAADANVAATVASVALVPSSPTPTKLPLAMLLAAVPPVTNPAGPLLLNVVQSVDERQPAWLPDAVWQPIVRSAARSPPPVRGELVDTCRPVPTTAVDAGDSAIGSSPG